jgi:glycosyltransferase involved in cell wall biosynthesis
MKILQIVPYFPPYNGGQERYILNLSKYLVKKGHDVDIITSNYPKCENYEKIDGINITRHKCLARPLRNPIVPGFFKNNKNFKEYDIIQTHNEHSISALAAAYIKRKYNLPLVLTCHGQLKFGNFFSDNFEKLYSRNIGKILFGISDCIVVLSESDKKYVSSFNINFGKIAVIPNAIDSNQLEHIIIDKWDPEAFSLGYDHEQNPKVLFVGPVIRRKGVENLIRAIPKVVNDNKFKNALFIFTGIGDYLEEAKLLAGKLGIQKNTLFTGYIGIEYLAMFYKISDLFVLPSFSEGLPTSILEAMFFSLPVIATDIPGVRDHFKDCALLIPPRDTESISTAISNLLNNSQLSKRLSACGNKLIKSKYQWDTVVDEYEKIYKRLGV